MIIFEKVRYKNFLATGDVSIELTLNENASTLVIGKNGAGKSTMTEALCFALFGRALRSINKPALVNSTNQKTPLLNCGLLSTRRSIASSVASNQQCFKSTWMMCYCHHRPR